ncbi:ribosome maturation factor RimP [Clostridium rectalis]|uniref:ribosome maturation factor RimP n=1 Tax=Clostridium rectalis TaxID=2040295 RepID=UPI000F635CBB|nr:ribosome maturation factor RimP [Clostridium rectalis]
MKKDALIEELMDLIKPIVENMNYDLYNLDFVKENRENYLRVYIDKQGEIELEDCEKVSRAVSEMLDEVDPIPDSYYLEVSSPGIERELFNDQHLKKYIGNNVLIKLSSLLNGSKNFEGKLKSFDEGTITIEVNEKEISIPKEKINKVNLRGDF